MRPVLGTAAMLLLTTVLDAQPSSTNVTLTTVPGLKVGHFTLSQRPTGCTVVLAEAGAVAGVDVRGAAPGTRETDLLNPVNAVDRVHAIVCPAIQLRETFSEIALGVLPALDAAGVRTRELIYSNRFGQVVWRETASNRLRFSMYAVHGH